MTLLLDPSQYGKGWAPVPQGALVQTLDQFLNYSAKAWTISGFMTSDRFVNAGRSAYRRPVSVWAHIKAALPLPGKLWRRWRARKTLATENKTPL